MPQHSQNKSGHRARKRFGQNFLHDESVIRRIVSCIRPSLHDHLVEIGPGQGALTAKLLEQVDSLDVIELDRDLIPLLKQRFATSHDLRIHEGDALKYDFQQLCSHSATGQSASLRIVGNLPYNISTPLLFHLFEYLPLIRDMHFMLQKEVVQRLAAQPGNKNYGRLSIMAQYYCDVSDLFDVSPHAFRPAPKVTSSIVRLQPKNIVLPAKNLQTLNQLLRATFGQRRKTLRNSLKNLLSTDQLEMLANIIDLGQRPEKLDIATFVQISNLLEGLDSRLTLEASLDD